MIYVIDNLIFERTNCLSKKLKGIWGRPVQSHPMKVKKRRYKQDCPLKYDEGDKYQSYS